MIGIIGIIIAVAILVISLYAILAVQQRERELNRKQDRELADAINNLANSYKK